MQWRVKTSTIPETLEQLRAILIENRQITNEDLFFHPKHPLQTSIAEYGIDLGQMKKAVERIHLAKERGEDVLIFGDYDADGVCATAVMWEALRSIGIVARPFIPDRQKHGYGLSAKSLEAILAEKKPDLVITVDNGIVAHDAFAQLKTLGIDAILTDHHLPEAQGMPDAFACVHTTKVCGTAVSWCVARELDRASAERSLDLVTIATIADQMPLLEQNRAFVVWGLQALRESQRVGLQLLCAKAGIELAELNVGQINYAISPRINAMGRLKHGMDALRLLCTTSLSRAEELVKELHDTNVSRQELTVDLLKHAMSRAEEWKDEHIIIVESEEYHEGVIGLIAGKLVEEFSKPAIVISVHDDVAKASARSVAGVNIIELIRLVKDDLLEAGGHPLAAGFGVTTAKISIIRQRLYALAKKHIAVEQLVKAVDVDCIIPEHLLQIQTAELIEEFAPFGQANRAPILGIRGLRVVDTKIIGKDGRHLKLGVIHPDHPQNMFTAIGWNMSSLAESLAPNALVDVAAMLEINEWRGRKKLQLIVSSIVDSEHLA